MSTPKNALDQGIMRCLHCGELNRTAQVKPCRLCHRPVYPRLPNSLQRTFALIISGFCLYIPANLFPIMTVTQLGRGEPHTILGGIIVLFQGGMTPIAILVFIASILVPLFKLAGLSVLIACVRYQWKFNAYYLTQLYRIIAFVGRWSMLDIFMISILVSLVDRQGVAQVLPGPAATAFALVVVLTMFAAKSFDPRLIWDYQST